MSFMQLISSIVLPVAMAFGAIAAWRMQKREPRSDDGRPAWRDDSLDDWRKQRDEEADVQRQEREEQSLNAAVAEEQAERKRHQRIGG